MKVLCVLLVVLSLLSVVSPAVISLEEGEDTTKRTMKWAMDPVEDPLPFPRFEIQDGSEAEYVKFAFLGTLDCSAHDDDTVVMAIYDIALGEWVCASTGDLPNDEAVDPDQEEGLLGECTEDGLVAVWGGRSNPTWDCSAKKPLLNQVEANVQTICRSGDVLTLDLRSNNPSPAGLCDVSTDRQVGENALVSLKRRSKPRNIGDPDEAFFVQTTSKAIGNLGSGGQATNHFDWNYWRWSPVRTTFSSAMGTYPPIFPFTGTLVAVSAATFDYDGNNFDSRTYSLTFHVVRVIPDLQTYIVEQLGDSLTINDSPASFVNDGTSPFGADAFLTPGQSVSIVLESVPGALNGLPTDVWFSVSLWVSHIQTET